MSSHKDIARRVALEGPVGFEPLVRATEQRLYRVALRILGRAADAEDAVQEAYVRAYDAIVEGRYDERTRAEAWLVAIVSRVSIDVLRRRGVRDKSEYEEVSAAGLSEDTIAGVIEIGRWLDTLPPDQRAAVVLRFLEEMTNAEVAEALGISEGAVEQRIIRARASLRRRDP